METNTLRATRKNQTLEIILRADGGSQPPLVQPASPEEERAYKLAGEALSRGSLEEAKEILVAAGFTISN